LYPLLVLTGMVTRRGKVIHPSRLVRFIVASRLVAGGAVDVIDCDEISGDLAWHQFQSELLLQGCVSVRAASSVDASAIAVSRSETNFRLKS
jgi:hypothetical protein